MNVTMRYIVVREFGERWAILDVTTGDILPKTYGDRQAHLAEATAYRLNVARCANCVESLNDYDKVH